MGDYGFAPNWPFIYSPALTLFLFYVLSSSFLFFFSILLPSTLTLSLGPAIKERENTVDRVVTVDCKYSRDLRIPLSLSISKSKEEKEEEKEEPFNSKRPCFHCDNQIRVSFPLNFQLHFSSLIQNLSQGYGVNSIALGSNC